MKIYNALSHSIKSDLRYYGESINRCLVSYYAISLSPLHIAFMRTQKKFIGKYFLDSGAFSAMAQKTSINRAEYESFIKNNIKLFSTYANLDVIGDSKATEVNQKYFEQNGLSPLPVFHYNTKYIFLKRMADKYGYIALGGLVPIAKAKDILKKHLDFCFNIISKNKNKIHLFGMSAKWLLETYPAFSCDSTSAFEGSIRGSVTDIRNQKKLNPKTSVKGFLFMDNDDKKYRQRVKYMMEGTKELEDDITALWAKRGVVWNE